MPRVAQMMIGWAILCSAAQGAESSAAEDFFEQRIRPVLANKCFACHSRPAQQLGGGLLLDSSAGIRAGGDGGPILVAGRASASRLIDALEHRDLEMPPDEQLSAQVIADFRHWIDQGAWVPVDEQLDEPPTDPDRARGTADHNHWAFQPIVRPPLPTVEHPEWCQTPLDRFLVAAWERHGLQPAPVASREVLIRRIYQDLCGLPPSLDEVQAFCNDPSPDATVKLVDRLLAAPQTGERWARHWLDVARYADTKDLVLLFGNDRIRPYAYTYRDWVVAAWNADLPYDQFVRLQLAADLENGGSADTSSLAALGFLNVGKMFDNNLPDIQDDRIDVVTRGFLGLTVSCARCHDHKYDPIPMADYYSLYGVFASSEVPLDLPQLPHRDAGEAGNEFERAANEIQQALRTLIDEQHAFLTAEARRRLPDYLIRVATEAPDPLETAVFYTSLSPEDLRPRVVHAWRRYIDLHSGTDDPLFALWGDLLAWTADSGVPFPSHASQVLDRWAAVPRGTGAGQCNPRIFAAVSDASLSEPADVARTYAAQLNLAWEQLESLSGNLAACDPATQQLLEPLLAADGPMALRREHTFLHMSRVERERYHGLGQQLDKLAVESPAAPPRAMALIDSAQPVEPRIFLRGNPVTLGRAVPRQFLELLSPQRQPFATGSGRQELAAAIVSPQNPLTSRVIVNRIWARLLGKPLVATPSDFGTRGTPPTHPELLDYLAARLPTDDGWSLKQLLRQILLSRTYQLSSEDDGGGRALDPDNRWMARANRRRRDLESMRDGMLAVAGRIDLRVGGRPVDLAQDADNRRRTLYGLVDRQELPNLYRVFDFASPDQSAAERPRTTTPQQALFGMNSLFVRRQAESLAEQVQQRQSQGVAHGINHLFRQVLARTADAEEIRASANYLLGSDTLETHTSGSTADEKHAGDELTSQADPAWPAHESWVELAQVLLLTNEFMYVDSAVAPGFGERLPALEE